MRLVVEVFNVLMGVLGLAYGPWSGGGSVLIPELRTQFMGHLAMPDLGLQAQEAWAAARVLVVGVGGLGCAVAQGLAISGVGHLDLADDDRIQASNLPRQCLFGPGDLGRLKVEAAAEALTRLQPSLNLGTLPEALTGQALRRAVAEVELVVDATDRPSSREAINLACQAAGIPLVFGSAIGWDGQVAVFDPNLDHSPCLACLFPGGLGEAEACGERGVFSPLVQLVGAWQVAEALLVLAGLHADRVGQLQLVDLQGPRLFRLEVAPVAGCPACALRSRHAPLP